MVVARKAGSSSSTRTKRLNISGRQKSSSSSSKNDISDGKNKSRYSSTRRILFGLTCIILIGGMTIILYATLTTTESPSITTVQPLTAMTARTRTTTPPTPTMGVPAATAATTTTRTENPNTKRSSLWEKYTNCTVEFIPSQPPRSQEKWRKPYLIPAYPASGSSSPTKKGDIVKSLIDSMTGSTSSTKNYHMSVRNKLRRCYGITETVACSQGHPFVKINLEEQTENFQHEIIFVIRNFLTAFPASHTDKAIAYHGAKGQASEEEWNTVRDGYITGAFQNWVDMIHWWRKTSSYDIGMYVSLERLMDDSQIGLDTVQQLHQLLTDGGFDDIIPKQDLPCLWYKSVQEMKIHQQRVSSTYQPGYTKQQQQFLLDEFEKLIQQVSDDQNLVSILNEYVFEIRNKIRLID